MPCVKKDSQKTALVIGAGPAGLSAARELARIGFAVKVFERSSRAGGLVHLIPPRRINKDAILRMAKNLDITYNTAVDLGEIGALAKKYDAVIIATGTQKNRSLKNFDTHSDKICFAIDFLEKDIRPKSVAVIGGGDTAIDCAIEARERGSLATVYYRKSREEMRALKSEVALAESAGVDFVFNTPPDDLGAFKEDLIVIAIGQDPDVPENLPKNVFLCGDAFLGATTVG
ncbi:MAG: FAD-dependent oxidoreductase, partial [Firmicutes bacterium]|nr:FAD-dependent oxidoreductase [Bacillota bacterium]